MPKIKLTPADVKGIRFGYANEEMSLGLLAQIYGVSRTQIWRIIRNLQHRSANASSLRDDAPPKRVNTESRELLRLLKGKFAD